MTSHSIQRLLAQLPAAVSISEGLQKCARELDKVYIPSRYPDAYTEGRRWIFTMLTTLG